MIVVVPHMRTPLPTTWSGSKCSLSRTPPGFRGHQKPCKHRARLHLQKVKMHPLNLGGCGLCGPKPLFYIVLEGHPVNVGGESSHPKIEFRGMGLQGGRICPNLFRVFAFLVFRSLFRSPPILVLIVFSKNKNKSGPTPSASPRLNVSSSLSSPFTAVLGYCFFCFATALACNENASSQNADKSRRICACA